jgi:hypothetical protein
MKRKLVGLGLGVAMSALGVVAVPAMASADTCYTGCSSPSGGGAGEPPTQQSPLSQTTPVAPPTESPASGGLALTGADIEGMAAIGAGAVVVGGLLVRRSRRRRPVTA